MNLQLRLNVEQITAAILLLSQEEKQVLQKRIPFLLRPVKELDELEQLGWLHAAESAFDFWNDPEEDIYNDLIPSAEGERQ